MLGATAANKNRGRSSLLKSRLSAYVSLCDDTGVQTIYGPYAPSRGRSRWRVQIRDSATGRKLSITAPTKKEAEKLKGQLEQELAQASPLQVHEALDQYAEYKATIIRSPREVANLIQGLKQLIPDGQVMGVSKAKAEEYYLAETKRPGKKGGTLRCHAPWKVAGSQSLLGLAYPSGHGDQKPVGSGRAGWQDQSG
jgi:hypothetical protein